MRDGAEMNGACTSHSGSYFRTLRVLAQVNATLGRGTLTFASALKAPTWKPKQAYLSKHYTTRMDELPFVW
jgi:hypothetical protein